MVESPFAALTAIVAPAVLTNASSILTLGIGNRLARVVDRTRVVLAELAHPEMTGTRRVLFVEQLRDLRRRTELLLSAQRSFFISLGSFAVAALLSVVGSIAPSTFGSAPTASMWVVAFIAGAAGVSSLAWGCWSMVVETRLAVRSLAKEAASFAEAGRGSDEVVRTLVILCLATFAIVGMPVRAWAQDASGATVADEDHVTNVWALAGVNADVAKRWQVIVRFGYLGGFESRLLLADATFAINDTLRLLVGDAYVEPTAAGSSDLNILRAGCLWRPIRGRLELENRALIEHRTGPGRPISPRVRDRLMLSWHTGGSLGLRLFGSAEAFALDAGLNAHRYQVGAARAAGRATVEIYWTQHRWRERAPFNAVGLTAFWRVGRS